MNFDRHIRYKQIVYINNNLSLDIHDISDEFKKKLAYLPFDE